MTTTAPPFTPSQVQDREVLAGLGHGAVVGRDDEQGMVDRGHPRQHVPDEPLVTRHVHEAEHGSVRRVWYAKPRSMLRPRVFSSGSRSVSTPSMP